MPEYITDEIEISSSGSIKKILINNFLKKKILMKKIKYGSEHYKNKEQ